VCMIAASCILPYGYYYSLRSSEEIIPIVRQIKSLLTVIFTRTSVWRDAEREIISSRIEMQLKVRNLLHSFGGSDPKLLQALDDIVPRYILNADTKRLVTKREDFIPIQCRDNVANREEIL